MTKTIYDYIIIAAVPPVVPWQTASVSILGAAHWCWRPGRPDYIWDIFIHMPAGLTFPLGNRFYDWRYESEPESGMNNRRIFHVRGNGRATVVYGGEIICCGGAINSPQLLQLCGVGNAADLILGNTPLPPSPAPFYQRQPHDRQIISG